MKTKTLTVLLLFASALITSCSKYEEGGPLFSKKGTLTKEWEFDDYDALNGNDDHPSENNSDYEETITFEKDGTFKREIDLGNSNSYDYEGKWEFRDDKKYIRVVYEGDGFSSGFTWRIYKLKKDELIFEEWDGDLITYSAK